MKEWTDTEGAAQILGITKRALEARRCYGGEAPPHAKIGRLVRYHVPTVERWMFEQMAATACAGATAP